MAVILKPRSNKQGIVDTSADLANVEGRENYTVLVKDLGLFEWVPTGTVDSTNIFAGKTGYWSLIIKDASTVSANSFKLYAFSMTYNGTTITNTVHANELGGAITWTKVSAGLLSGTGTGLFPSGKVPNQKKFIYDTGTDSYWFIISRQSDNEIRLQIFMNDTPGLDLSFTNEYFEVKVFN
jgi:hypothetical protein